MLAPSEYDREAVRGYLDTATYGLPPRSTLAALDDAHAGWQRRLDWHVWEADGEACRALFADIVGAPAEDVALLPAVSTAAGIVAASLRGGPGDNVVVYERDFASNFYPWLALRRAGIEVRLEPLETLAEAVDARTVLVAVSAVQSADGAVADLDALKRTGVRLFVDATHGVGALPLDLEGVDYLAAAAYKWLLCPRGLCFLYVRRERLDEIEPWFAGWKAGSRPYDVYYGPSSELAADARRLDISLPWFVAAGSRPSLEVIRDVGVDRIAAHDLALARRFAEELGLPEPAAPIVSVTVDDADDAVERLGAAGVACAPRAGGVRLSFHLYNDASDVELALEALAPAGVS